MEHQDWMAGREILFEMIPMGRQMRVAAIDAKSGTEVIVIVPVSTTQTQMKALAIAKLRRRMGAGAGE